MLLPLQAVTGLYSVRSRVQTIIRVCEGGVEASWTLVMDDSSNALRGGPYSYRTELYQGLQQLRRMRGETCNVCIRG